MTGAVALNPRFPNLRPEVVEGYLASPEHVFAQVLDGELFIRPSPGARHQFIVGHISCEVFDRAEWTILYGMEVHLGPLPDILVPDIAGWRKGRLPEGDDYPTVAPDWVCEVLSTGTEALDRGRKRRIWRREGVGHLWIVDPGARLLEVYRLENGRWSEVDTFEGNATVRAEPFDAIELDLSLLWPSPKAAP